MDMSKSQIEMSSSENNISTEQSSENLATTPNSENSDVGSVKENEDNNQSQQLEQEMDYEKSVTEKENLLMSSFNKMSLNNGNGLNNNLLETNNNINLLNGQHAKDVQATDLIIGDSNGIATNGHDSKNSIENTL
jgi:hypothetical protein